MAGRLIVEHKKSETPEEKKLGVQISNMIGFGLYQLQFANNDELEITRRKMVRYDESIPSQLFIIYISFPSPSLFLSPLSISLFLFPFL